MMKDDERMTRMQRKGNRKGKIGKDRERKETGRERKESQKVCCKNGEKTTKTLDVIPFHVNR